MWDNSTRINVASYDTILYYFSFALYSFKHKNKFTLTAIKSMIRLKHFRKQEINCYENEN